MTRSGRSARDHHWCAWIYEAVVIMMVIDLDLICTYSKNQYCLNSYRLPIFATPVR